MLTRPSLPQVYKHSKIAVVCGVTAFCDRFRTFPRAVTIINCPMCSACSAIFYGNNFVDKDDRDYLANERIRTRRGVNIQFFYPEYSLHLHGFSGVQQSPTKPIVSDCSSARSNPVNLSVSHVRLFTASFIL